MSKHEFNKAMEARSAEKVKIPTVPLTKNALRLIGTTSSVMIVIMSATRKYLSKFMCSPSMRVCDIPVMFVTTKPLKEED